MVWPGQSPVRSPWPEKVSTRAKACRPRAPSIPGQAERILSDAEEYTERQRQTVVHNFRELARFARPDPSALRAGWRRSIAGLLRGLVAQMRTELERGTELRVLDMSEFFIDTPTDCAHPADRLEAAMAKRGFSLARLTMRPTQIGRRASTRRTAPIARLTELQARSDARHGPRIQRVQDSLRSIGRLIGEADREFARVLSA